MKLGPKLNRDWVGLRVRLLGKAQNQIGTIPAGTTGTIASYTGGRMGIRFEADACQHCGISMRVSGMVRRDFAILTPSSEWKDTRGKGRPYRH
jgi:hypothetical protein